MDAGNISPKPTSLKTTDSDDNAMPDSLKRAITYDDHLSTFDSWPQHVFPSCANSLTYELEMPYAFSHHVPAFFWSREDALAAVHWNIYARPPCLNCVTSGEIDAKLCDRLARQERHYGTVRCCHRCEELEMEESCIEMIELRVDWPKDRELAVGKLNLVDLPNGPNRLRRTNKGWMDKRIWTEEERACRAHGTVIWRPINLNYGDAKAKKSIVAQWHSGEGQGIARPEFSAIASKSALRLARWQVDHWDGENREKRSESQSTDYSISDKAVPKSQTDIGLPDSETICNVHSFEHWSSLLLSARIDLYQANLSTYGRAKANQVDEDFERVSLDLLAHVRKFLTRRQTLRKDGRSNEEAHYMAMHELREETRTWIYELIPALLQYETSVS